MGKVGKRITIAAVVLVVAFFVASFFIDQYMLDRTFTKNDKTIEPGGTMPTFADYASDHVRTPVEFTMDGATLRGYVYESRAVENPKGFVVFRHGIYSNHGFYLPEIIALADRGWKVFAYDALGAGESDGDSYIGMVQSALDVKEAVVFARREGLVGDLPIVLWGHSWGGYGVAAALHDIPWVQGCVTMSGYNEPVGVIMEFAKRMVGGIAATQLPTLWLNNKLEFGDKSDLSALDGINSTSAPVLVIHGTQDTTVEHDGSGIIAQRDRITNPNVEYFEPSEEGRNGHNSYFYSREANEYGAMKRAELKELTDQYPDGLPDDVRAEFFAAYDVLRANTADPELIGIIDNFLTRAIGGTMKDETTTTTPLHTPGNPYPEEIGALVSVYYSYSGNSLGNLYSLETVAADDGTMMVMERRADMHSDPIVVREFRAPDDIVAQVEAIVDEADMRNWGKLEASEFIPLDAATPRLSFTFENTNPETPWHVFYGYSDWDVQPDDGKAFDAIRDLLSSYAVEENLIREYTEKVRN